jgi:hypothetical protein
MRDDEPRPVWMSLPITHWATDKKKSSSIDRPFIVLTDISSRKQEVRRFT